MPSDPPRHGGPAPRDPSDSDEYTHWIPLAQPEYADRAEFLDPPGADWPDPPLPPGLGGPPLPAGLGGPPLPPGPGTEDRLPPRHAGRSRGLWSLSSLFPGRTAKGDQGAGVPPDDADRNGPRRHRVLALVAILGMGAVLGLQTFQLHSLGGRLAAADRQLGEVLLAENARAADIESRTADLEKKAGAAFNPEAISAAVVPSVFRVRAGAYTGTAFAVGDRAGQGRANLLTNYHVVASVWEDGRRRVYVERGGVEVPATIVGANEERDLAHLRLERDAKGLDTAGVPVQTGQQIVVVGAPLGLEDSVTTGVVSAFRKDREDGGPVIQFDAPINPGNSGGPVINAAKQVVGLATAKARDAEGIGLAIPIGTACDTFAVC
ncbi:MAG TPA: S1C family serine protease [Actinoplanes sp.]